MRKLIETLESRRLLSATWYVDANTAGAAHDGTTWDTAYLEIQQGLTSAVAGDEIHVADGNYVSTVASRINLKRDVSVLGGFAGSGAAEPDARDPSANVSVISGTSSYNDGLVIAVNVYAPTVFDGFTVQSSGWGTVSMKTNSATLTINNCIFRGGMGINNVNAAPTITNCFFDALSGGSSGGGMTNSGGSAVITNCTFTNCFGNTGGAMRNQNTTVVVTGCIFSGNAAAHEGQAIYNYSSTATFTDCKFTKGTEYNFDPDTLVYNVGASQLTLVRCTFLENYGNNNAGIINSSSSLPVSLTECTFTRNSSGYVGGGISATGSSSLSVTSCIFQGNSAYGYGGAIYADLPEVRITNSVFSGNEVEYAGGALYLANGTVTITNCTFSGNTVTDYGGPGGALYVSNVNLYLRNSILAGDIADEGAEIYVEPIGTTTLHYEHSLVSGSSGGTFVRPPDPGLDNYWGTIDDDYGDLRPRLSPTTVDAGDNFFVPAGITTDIAGNPRIVNVPGMNDPGATVDIGAYEYTAPFAVTSGAYPVDAIQPTITVTFNGDVKDWATLAAGDLVLLDPVTNLPIAGLPSSAVTYNSSTRTATWVFSAALPDGNYRAKMAAGSVTDTAGNPLSADFVFDFFVLPGDANRDRIVDVNDLLILATNWYGTAKTFTQGDFNHDGVVNQTDLGILAIHWQQKLAPPPLPSAPVPTRTASIAARKPTRMASDVIL